MELRRNAALKIVWASVSDLFIKYLIVISINMRKNLSVHSINIIHLTLSLNTAQVITSIARNVSRTVYVTEQKSSICQSKRMLDDWSLVLRANNSLTRQQGSKTLQHRADIAGPSV
jgi:hypothetical protein